MSRMAKLTIRGSIGELRPEDAARTGPDYAQVAGLASRPTPCPHQMERVTGIEPAQPAWKAGTLPLSYTRIVRETNDPEAETQ